MSKKTIWIINHYAGNMFESEGGRHYWFAKELKTRGYNVVVFCANSRYEKTGTFFNFDGLCEIENTKIDVPFVFVKSVPYDQNGMERAKDMVAFFRNVKKASKQIAASYEEPDVILASSVHPLTLLAGEQIAKKWDIPCICEMRDLWPEAFFYAGALKKDGIIGRMLIAGEHHLYKHADALIFLKEGDHTYLLENKWDKENGGDIDMSLCYYINNGVALDLFSKQIDEGAFFDEDLLSGKMNVVYTGTIRPTNNVENIIDAAKLLKSRNDIQFLIYGAGSECKRLTKRIVDEELDNIKMKGFVNKKSIPFILSKASLNLLNYSASGYNWARGNSSNKLFEYMAAGKPIISNVNMGYNLIERYQCGLTLLNGTPEELAKSVESICDLDKSSYSSMCLNAFNGAKDFDFKILTDSLERVLERVLNA